MTEEEINDFIEIKEDIKGIFSKINEETLSKMSQEQLEETHLLLQKLITEMKQIRSLL
jgi:hypothetical protein